MIKDCVMGGVAVQERLVTVALFSSRRQSTVAEASREIGYSRLGNRVVVLSRDLRSFVPSSIEHSGMVDAMVITASGCGCASFCMSKTRRREVDLACARRVFLESIYPGQTGHRFRPRL
jgi:hypothetical protein